MRPMEFLRFSSKTISSKSEQKWVLNYISSIMVAVFNGVGWPAKKIKKLKLKKIGYQLGSKVGVWVIFESLSCSLLCYLNRRFLPLYMKSCCSRYCSFLFFKQKNVKHHQRILGQIFIVHYYVQSVIYSYEAIPFYVQ